MHQQLGGTKLSGKLSLGVRGEKRLNTTGLKYHVSEFNVCRKRRLKWVLGAWGYKWATQSPGDINMEIWSSRLGVGRRADNPTPEKVNS
jgi:hypothetical protein